MTFTTGHADLITRAEVWSSQIKETLRDELRAKQYVWWLPENEFPDGDNFKIPSFGTAIVRDYEEGQPVVYDPMDVGQFVFNITEHKQSGNSITKKTLQDSFKANMLMSRFLPEQERALMVNLEGNILNIQANQAAGSNDINGYSHRYAGGNSGKLELQDFAYANLALTKANVPDRNRVAVVDPSFAFELETITNIVNISDNPRWEGMVTSGMASGMTFVRNIFGIDVYTSNYLPVTTETINDRDGNSVDLSASGTAVVNQVFCMEQMCQPFIGGWRQMPEVETKYDMDLQKYDFLTTARYGLGLVRPESLVCIPATNAI